MAQPAARIGDMHSCPVVSGETPHTGGPIGPMGSPDVFIEGRAAARLGDLAACQGPPDQITRGSQTVFINGKSAARQGDGTAHGGSIVQGALMVNIG